MDFCKIFDKFVTNEIKTAKYKIVTKRVVSKRDPALTGAGRHKVMGGLKFLLPDINPSLKKHIRCLATTAVQTNYRHAS